MLEVISKLEFLNDITESCYDNNIESLFKNMVKVYEVKSCPSIRFKMSSDWEGNWLAGTWYFNGERVTEADKLINLLSKKAAVKVIYELDVLNKISSWKKSRYLEQN